ncbi:MAG: ornithine carbamoyltransferase [Candidatus Micrarchaeota archaeon]|nr:ornithine carbamoyltransferase [Candidatus Micrarchaeota archaeon]
MKKNLLSLLDLSKTEIEKILSDADSLKDKTFPYAGKTAALLFNRPSTRTLVSFEVALKQLGYGTIHLDYVFTQMVRGERLGDTSKAISQYVSLIVARLLPHSMLDELAKSSEVPVINAATDREHPCQALGDMYTLKSLGKLKQGNKLVFIGDPTDAVANSLAIAATKLGMHFVFLCPKSLSPDEKYLAEAKKLGRVEVSNDISVVKGAAAIYVSSWAKDSSEQENPDRLRDFLPYQVNSKMLLLASKDVVVMHPLPAFRGQEITDEVLDGGNSVVWQQAKNRLYVQKAIIKQLM